MNRWYWLCPWLAVALAVAVLMLVGLTWWSALFAALLLVCPVLVLWGMFITRSKLDEPVVHTHGMTMDWAVPIYDWYCPKLGLGPAFREATLSYAALKAGERVLDVGCGTGVLTRLAARAVGSAGHVIGIDPGPAMLAVARRNAAASRAEFRLAAIESLPFANASFDIVLSSCMLHHLPPEVKSEGLCEVYRVLRPGGRLLVVDIDRPANPFWWLLCWPLLFFHFTAPNLRGEVPIYLSAAGFTPVTVRGRKGGLLTFWLAMKPTAGG